jgi:Domain of unknown function (DUF427)
VSDRTRTGDRLDHNQNQVGMGGHLWPVCPARLSEVRPPLSTRPAARPWRAALGRLGHQRCQGARARDAAQGLEPAHVRVDLLAPTETVSHCPYKGQAEWWSVRAGEAVHDDLASSYRTPLPESQKIAGLVAFYNEKVDIHVDGVLQERPRTKFS